MKTLSAVFRKLSGALVAAMLGLLSSSAAQAQIFVVNFGSGTIGEYNLDGTTVNASLITLPTNSSPAGIAISGSNLFVSTLFTGKIGEYTISGTTVNASLISGLGINVLAMAVSGSSLFVANTGNETISEYTTFGTTVNASLVSGVNESAGLAVSGSNLFISDGDNGKIGEYTTSGATVNASLISGLNGPAGIAISGSHLFVANFTDGTIGEYNLDGTPVGNGTLISGLNGPTGIAVLGSNLFVTFKNSGTIGKYTTSGATVNATLISGLNGPFGIAVQNIPESFSQWETSYSINSATTATPENDGVPNLLKYLYDINPTVPMAATDRAALPTVGMTTIVGTQYLTLTYRQYVLQTGITINVQTSPDLQVWTPVTNPTIVQTGNDPNTGDPIMQVQVAATGTRQFIRLDVTQP